MNNTFDLRRFGLYARKEFRENWKVYTLGLVGVLSILLYFVYDEWEHAHHSSVIKMGYFLNIFRSLSMMMGPMTWIAGSYILKTFSNRQQTFAALTLPVSAFEQFLYAWFVAVPLSTLVCFALWKMAWVIAIPYFLADFPDLSFDGDFLFWTTNNPTFPVLFVGGASVFMWGAVSLGRLNFLKTLGILIAIGLVFEWGQNRILKAIFPVDFSINSYSSIPWLPQTAQIKYQGIYTDTFHSTFENIYGFWWVLCVPLLLYAITFLKIKEKEI